MTSLDAVPPVADEIVGDATEVKEIFAEVLGLPISTPAADLVYGRTPGWDSLAHMEIVAQLEERFDLLLDTDDILAMRDFATTVEILCRLGVVLG